MNWDYAIDHHRAALLKIVESLMVWVGMVQGVGPRKLSLSLYRTVLSILGPAESALRRLIVIAAREVAAPAFEKRPAPAGLERKSNPDRIPAFPLFDVRISLTMKHLSQAAGHPRILLLGDTYPATDRKASSDEADAAAICRRLNSMQRALENLRGQAKRLVRVRAHRDPLKRPTRPGRAPCYRQQPKHAVDMVLRDLHELALWAQAPPGTPMVMEH